MKDDRQPYDCRPEYEKWKAGERNYSIVVKYRTFAFLGYPMKEPDLFIEMRNMTEKWAKEHPLENPNPNQAGLDDLSDYLANSEVGKEIVAPKGGFKSSNEHFYGAPSEDLSDELANTNSDLWPNWAAAVLFLLIGVALTVIGAVIYVLYYFLEHGSWVG